MKNMFILLVLLLQLCVFSGSAECELFPGIHRLVLTGNTSAVSNKLEHGENVDRLDGLGNTPLHIAVQEGNNDIASLLIAKGADINAANAEGLTPLHLAVKFGRFVLVNTLLDSGARIDLQDKENFSAYDYADKNKKENREILNRIVRHKTEMAQAELNNLAKNRYIKTKYAGTEENIREEDVHLLFSVFKALTGRTID